MPCFYFNQRFAGAVEQGVKKQAVHRKCLEMIRQDDPLYLFAETPGCTWRKIRTTHCYAVVDVFISSNKSVILNNRVLTDGEKCELAVNDGFVDFDEFFNFYRNTGGLPFDGQVVEWL